MLFYGLPRGFNHERIEDHAERRKVHKRFRDFVYTPLFKPTENDGAFRAQACLSLAHYDPSRKGV